MKGVWLSCGCLGLVVVLLLSYVCCFILFCVDLCCVVCCALGAVLSCLVLVLACLALLCVVLSCLVLACLASPCLFFVSFLFRPHVCFPPIRFLPILSTRPGAAIVILSLGGVVPLQMAGNEFDVAKSRLVAVDVMCLLIGAIA